MEVYQLLILCHSCEVNAFLYALLCTQPGLKELELTTKGPLWPKRRGEEREREREREGERERAKD